MTSGEGILSSTGFPTPLLITPSGKAAPRRPDPGIRRRIQIGTLRPIRVDHTKCLQVAIKTHSFSSLSCLSLLLYLSPSQLPHSPSLSLLPGQAGFPQDRSA